MVDRRRFLSNGILMAGLPLLGTMQTDTAAATKKNRQNSMDPLAFIRPKAGETYYISHRGVHLNQRAAGENSIESLRLAKRAGFQCVEFDVRFTSDGRPVVIHDETINRTLRDHDGNKLTSPVYVRDLTFNRLRSDYLVYTENKKGRSIVPSFEEYLEACRLYKVIPFVEIKEHDISRAQYDSLLQSLDKIIGRDNYVITSNNKVNDRIREFGYADIVVMGILYQTTFGHIQNWKNSIMAISASRFSAEEMKSHVQHANQERIPTESHADTIDRYNHIIRNGIDFISTDMLMPEHTGLGQVMAIKELGDAAIEELHTDGHITNDTIILKSGQKLDLIIDQYKELTLYGVCLEIEYSGSFLFHFGRHQVNIQTRGKEYFRYPVLLHKQPFHLQVQANDASLISGLRIMITKF